MQSCEVYTVEVKHTSSMQSSKGHCNIYSMQSCEVYSSAAFYNAICNLVNGIAAYTVCTVCNLVK